jgi:hypothetical protein
LQWKFGHRVSERGGLGGGSEGQPTVGGNSTPKLKPKINSNKCILAYLYIESNI